MLENKKKARMKKILWIVIPVAAVLCLIIFLPHSKHIVLHYDDGEMQATLDARVYVHWWGTSDADAKGTFTLHRNGEEFVYQVMHLFSPPDSHNPQYISFIVSGYDAAQNRGIGGSLDCTGQYELKGLDVSTLEEIAFREGCTTKNSWKDNFVEILPWRD